MTTETETEQTQSTVTPEQERHLLERLSAARTKLLASVPFFGHLCLNLRPRIAKPQDQVPTAAVAPDGTLILNHEFCDKLTDPQLRGLLCHEVLHPALFCWARQGTRYAIVSGPNGERFSLWNLAHDLSFNPEILELAQTCAVGNDIELPPGGALDMKLKGKSAEEIYDELLEQALKNRNKGSGGTSGILMKIPGGGHSIGDDIRQDLSESADGKKAAEGDTGAQQRLENEWKVNVVAAAQVHKQERQDGQGHLPAGLQKVVDEIVDPRVDWRDVLSRWIGENGRRQDYTYRRPARRSESAGAYLPSTMKFGIADVVVLWDTSGSMNGREREILGDVQGICEDLGIKVRVMCCDTQVHTDVNDIEDAITLIEENAIRGGGGSDFIPAFRKLDEEAYDGVMVCFTDGYISVPQTKPVHLKAVLWCLAGSDVDPSQGAWGEVLKIED